METKFELNQNLNADPVTPTDWKGHGNSFYIFP